MVSVQTRSVPLQRVVRKCKKRAAGYLRAWLDSFAMVSCPWPVGGALSFLQWRQKTGISKIPMFQVLRGNCWDTG